MQVHNVRARLCNDRSETLGCDFVRRAISEFEPRTWHAFWRVAVLGHPVDLIASDMGVTPAAVRKAKSRILHRLKEEIGDLID